MIRTEQAMSTDVSVRLSVPELFEVALAVSQRQIRMKERVRIIEDMGGEPDLVVVAAIARDERILDACGEALGVVPEVLR